MSIRTKPQMVEFIRTSNQRIAMLETDIGYWQIIVGHIHSCLSNAAWNSDSKEYDHLLDRLSHYTNLIRAAHNHIEDGHKAIRKAQWEFESLISSPSPWSFSSPTEVENEFGKDIV